MMTKSLCGQHNERRRNSNTGAPRKCHAPAREGGRRIGRRRAVRVGRRGGSRGGRPAAAVCEQPEDDLKASPRARRSPRGGGGRPTSRRAVEQRFAGGQWSVPLATASPVPAPPVAAEAGAPVATPPPPPRGGSTAPSPPPTPPHRRRAANGPSLHRRRGSGAAVVLLHPHMGVLASQVRVGGRPCASRAAVCLVTAAAPGTAHRPASAGVSLARAASAGVGMAADAAAARAFPTAVRPPPMARRADAGVATSRLVDEMKAAGSSFPAVVPPGGGSRAGMDPVVGVVGGGGDSGGGGGGGGGGSGNVRRAARTHTVHPGGAYVDAIVASGEVGRPTTRRGRAGGCRRGSHGGRRRNRWWQWVPRCAPPPTPPGGAAARAAAEALPWWHRRRGLWRLPAPAACAGGGGTAGTHASRGKCLRSRRGGAA